MSARIPSPEAVLEFRNTIRECVAVLDDIYIDVDDEVRDDKARAKVLEKIDEACRDYDRALNLAALDEIARGKTTANQPPLLMVPPALLEELASLIRARDPTIDVRSFLMGLTVGWCAKEVPDATP